MNKIRILLIVAILFVMLIPAAVAAQGVWYCDALIIGGGDGSWHDPWGCAGEGELESIVFEIICEVHGGGTLYQIFDGYYVVHEIGFDNGECGVLSSTRVEGYPPNTGIEDIPMPIIIGAVAVGGAALVLAGLFLRRRNLAS